MRTVVSLLTGAALIAAAFATTPGANLHRMRKVNAAVEVRSDPYWQRALSESLKPRRPFGERAILARGNEREKLIALTFDDGPHAVWTEKLLALLKQEHVPATFFIVGKQAEKYPDLVREEAADGHLIANHTFSHVTLTNLPVDEVETEYRACNDVVKAITGETPKFCRPPGGDKSPDVIKGATEAGLTTVLWTDDPGDYASPGADVIKSRLLSRISNGGIILLHDGIQQTLDVLPEVIAELRKMGYKFVTVDKLLESREPSNRAGRLARL